MKKKEENSRRNKMTTYTKESNFLKIHQNILYWLTDKNIASITSLMLCNLINEEKKENKNK